MSEENVDVMQENETSQVNGENETHTAENVESLADSVKALSPTQLVMKRFFRSKLSIVGLVIIISLFVFAFLGPVFSPYGETQSRCQGDHQCSAGKGLHHRLLHLQERCLCRLERCPDLC